MTTQALQPAIRFSLSGLEHGLRSAARALARWSARRRTRESLCHLSDHLLKDIGVEVICVPGGPWGRSVVRAYRAAPRG